MGSTRLAMAVTVGDLFEARIHMARGTNEFLCVFHYRMTALGTSPVNTFADEIEDNLFPAINSVQHPSFYISKLFVRDVFDDERFAERTYLSTAYEGILSGDPLPDYVAVQYKSVRTRLDMRNGYKRIPGFVDDGQVGNGFNGAYTAGLSAVAAVFNSDLASAGNVYDPVIVKRIKYTAPSGKPAYRLPNTQLEFVYSEAQFALYPFLSTQNSRKSYG